MKRLLWCFIISVFLFEVLDAQQVTNANSFNKSQTVVFSKQELQNKIKGGWAGQTIGVTFGGPYEFRFNGTFIQDYQPLEWHDGYLKETMLSTPGLYDDLYMDLTFVDVFEKYGLDAPLDSFANAFAYADFETSHFTKIASPPSVLIALSVSLSSTQSAITTFVPLFANAMAVALPIPNEPPVTIATFS